MTSPLDRKLKVGGPVVITANRAADGAVVYRSPEGGWTTRLDGAAIAFSVAAAQEVLAAATRDDVHAIGAYVAPILVAPDGRVRPGNLRERIRDAGPTVELAAAALAEPDHVRL